jgi:hypothetical protein
MNRMNGIEAGIDRQTIDPDVTGVVKALVHTESLT